jgi:hypothetical protein
MRLPLGTLGVLAVLAALPRTFAPEVEVPLVNGCPSSIDVPVRLVLAAPPGALAAGADVALSGQILMRRPIAALHVSLAAEGPVELTGPMEMDVEPAARSRRQTSFEIPVRYLGDGRSRVSVRLTAIGSDGVRYEKNEALYAIVRGERAIAGMGGFTRLELQALEEDVRAGRLPLDQARVTARDLQRPAVTLDQAPRPRRELTAEEARLSDALADATDVPAARSAHLRPSPLSAGGTVTVQGAVNWLDENGNAHAAFGMLVQVRDEELIGSELVAQAVTGTDGQYNFVVDNDDGFGAGDRDIFVRIITSNGAVNIRTAGILGAPYEADSAVHDETPDGSTVTENFTCANTGTGPACGLLTGASYVASYAADLNGGTFLSGINLEWPGDPGSANFNGSRINLRPGDQFDWDVMFHEYGHYVMSTFNFANNPGGPHNLGDCISDVQGTKDRGTRMSWAEGWPTFFGTAGQQFFNLASLNVPRVGDVSYTDTGESNFTYSLEAGAAQDNLGLGEDNELAVQRILWDLFDTPADGRDTVDRTGQGLFDTVNAADPVILSTAWAALRAGLSNADDLAFGAITTDHAVGPSLISPAAGNIVGPGANFSWNRLVGCSTTFDGDDFDLVFYDGNTLASLLTIPGLGTPSATLSLADYQTLVGSTHQVRWAVEGRNSSSPATGPYLGENFAITLNRPPVANAGPDQTVECTSPTTTPVQMNGTGSSDPDGDALTYLWTAPGVVFNDPTSATPIGQFPLGTRIATLTVDDSIQQDSDTASVTVNDTTPPVIVCPAPITVECTTSGGTPASHPQIAAFLAGASATDVCDANPVLSNNAPAFFLLGVTPVTFTATDAQGNSSQCVALVTIQDTTPPVVSLALDRYSLWPPNHAMITINASVVVTDICDPTPGFALTAVTSNEPENGPGDGNTVDDIQGAAIGTSDTQFELRAERSGRGDGRIYSILYTGFDDSGNTTPAPTQVVVPHNR